MQSFMQPNDRVLDRVLGSGLFFQFFAKVVLQAAEATDIGIDLLGQIVARTAEPRLH